MQTSPSYSGRISDEILLCKICFCRYDGGSKLPKSLPVCSHSFCLECVRRNHAAAGRPSVLVCPLCRQPNVLPHGGPNQLTNNYTVMNLLDIMDEQRSRGGHMDERRSRGGHASPAGSPRRPVPAPRSRCVGCAGEGGTSTFTYQLNCRHRLCEDCVESLCHRTNVWLECPQCGLRTSLQRVYAQKQDSENTDPSAGSPGRGSHTRRTPQATHGHSELMRTSWSDSRLLTLANSSPGTSGTVTSPSKSPPKPAPRVSPSGGAGGHRFTSTLPSRQIDRPPPFNPDYVSRRDVTEWSPTKPPAPPPRTIPRGDIDRINLYGTAPRRKHARPPLAGVFDPPPVTSQQLCHNAQSLPDLDSAGAPSPARSYRSPPEPPFRRTKSFSSAINGGLGSPTRSVPGVPLQLVLRFGSHSDHRLQAGTFRQPSDLCVSPSGLVGVSDSQHMTFQIFDQWGNYVSMFPVIGIKAACFLGNDLHVAVATHQGVGVYNTTGGQPLKTVTMESVTCVTSHRGGVIVGRAGGFTVLQADLRPQQSVTKLRQPRRRLLQRSAAFQRLTAVHYAEDTANLAAVDAGAGRVYVSSVQGRQRLSVKPYRLPCGRLQGPRAVVSDPGGYLIVADTDNKRLLKFNSGGAFVSELEYRAAGESRLLRPLAVAVDRHHMDRLLVAVVDDANKFAEIRVFNNPSQ